MPSLSSPTDKTQFRLLILAAVFLSLFALALTISPAARAHSWDVHYRWDQWLSLLVWGLGFAIAHYETARRLPERDPFLLPIAALLSGWGVLTIWRLSPAFGLRQTGGLCVALAAFILGLRLPSDLGFLRRYKYLWLTGGLLLVAATLLLGANPLGYGPRLWLGCCGVYFQPSEPLKLLLVVYLAAYFAGRLMFYQNLESGYTRGNTSSSTHFLEPPRTMLPILAPTFIMTGLALLLLMVQRDLGTASIFLFLYAAIVYIASGRKRILVILILALALGAMAGYALFDVVRLRVDAWLNPWLDPSGRSYQIVQSLIAIGNGGLSGRGPGLGYPGLVPVAHSDFIFAAIAEEGGLPVVLGLLVVIALLAVRGMGIALQASDAYRRYLAVGLTAYLVGQSILIIGGNLRLLPLTGVTLPFISDGGSSLLTSFLSLLILCHISQRGESRSVIPLNTAPYMYLGGFLLAGISAAALLSGWWMFYRGPALITRTDNPRRIIVDRSVRRGALLDRHNTPIVETVGQPGDYARQYLYPPLSPIVGYTHPFYGQSGLEAILDPYLSGRRGNPGLTVWWNHLLYGQPPTGLDVRLSLDLELQRVADNLLADHIGALVLLNAQTGEILVMASHPTFDPNRLDQDWMSLVENASAPLLDRADLGQYLAGAALGPFLWGAVLARGELPALPTECNVDGDWASALVEACPEATKALKTALGRTAEIALYQSLGLPTSGYTDQRLSPVQMALAAATLSAGGMRPVSRLVMAVDTPQAGWVILPPSGEPSSAMPAAAAEVVANALASASISETISIWQSIAHHPNQSWQSVTWYLGGTLPDWQGVPLALAVLLEEDNPSLAEAIGQGVLEAALHP